MKNIEMKVGDKVPHCKFRVRSLGEWTDTNTDTYFKDKKVILFALPGAFTPTCSNQQLPGYEKIHDVFKAHGVDDIYCLSVNDEFVMQAWLLSYTEGDKILGIADGNGEVSTNLDLLVDKTANYMGKRSTRFAMIIRDNNIHELLIEEPGEYKKTSAENLLTKI